MHGPLCPPPERWGRCCYTWRPRYALGAFLDAWAAVCLLGAGGAAAHLEATPRPGRFPGMPGHLSAPWVAWDAAVTSHRAAPGSVSPAADRLCPGVQVGHCTGGTFPGCPIVPRWWGKNLTWMDACGLRHPGAIFSRLGGGSASLRLAACGHACARVYACAPKRAARYPRLAP